MIPPELEKKIALARSLADRPHSMRFAEPATVTETLHLRATTRGDAPYLTYLCDDGTVRSYTYAQFYARVRRIAAMLYVFAGVQRGERIVTAMHNHDDMIAVAFAAWHLGATVVPLNMGEDDKRLAYILQHSRAKIVIVLSEYADRIRPLARAVEKIEEIIRIGGTPAEGEVSFDSVVPPVDVPQFAAPEKISPDDEALIVYTSGTTGVPKGVVLTQYNLIADAYAISSWQGITAQTRMMCVLPVHHVNGMEVTHITPLFVGASVVLNRKFSAKTFFSTVAQHKIEVVSVVPTLLQFLIEAAPPEFDAKKSAPTLRYIICGAGPLTVDLASRFEDRFGIPICHGYGLSESTCYSCFVPVVDNVKDATHTAWMRQYGYPSIGAPLATNEMAIHDDNGQPLGEGQKGEIVIRGHNIMPGYYDNLKANENAFTHGWFRSGDEGFFKAGPDGRPYFFISGRFKELIVRGGVKISPLEIDEVLNRIEGVQAAMAVGFENVTYGEEVGAYVVKKPGSNTDEEKIIAACRAVLPFAMAPKVVIFGETFPVTSTGKYQRNTLKPLFAAHQKTQFRESR
jgi:long-chain acyl-CoA synthetase